MIFTATIIPGSTIDRMWAGHNRNAGELHGVLFTKQGSIYASGQLDNHAAQPLLQHPSVRVETTGRMPPVHRPHPVEQVVPAGEAPTPPELVAPEFRPKARSKPPRK